MNSPVATSSLPLLKKSDQVFQLSLTELAFIIIFILLILFGWLVQHEQLRNALLAKELKELEEANSLASAWERTRDEVAEMLKGAGARDEDRAEAVDRTLSELVERRTALVEQEKLRQRVDALDSELTALTALRAELEKAGNKSDATEEAVKEALALKVALEKALAREVSPAEAPKLVEQLAIAVKMARESKGVGVDVKELVRSNERMKDLVAHYERRLNMRGGIDFPPCWLDSATGKVEYVFRVDLLPSGVLLTPAWPAYREKEARALPAVDALLNLKGLKLEEFNALMQGIDQNSRAANCRHYVVLDNHVGDLATFNRLRFGVENFFYKYETRK